MIDRRALTVAAALAFVATLPLSAQTASLVQDINTSGPVDLDSDSSFPRNLTAVGSKVFFTASEPSSGRQIWVSDGTSAGTELLHDLSDPEEVETQILGAVRGLFTWTVRRDSLGVTLMRSDGTRAGTFELFPGTTGLITNGPDQGYSVLAGDRLYFAGCQSADCHLWTSDGTAAGTHALKEAPGARRLTAAGNRLYLIVFTGGVEQLWTSDGTPAGTMAVSHFSTVQPFTDGAFFLPSGNGVFFSARTAAGEELWTSDGTPTGTKRITDFTEASPFSGGLNQSSLAAANGRPLFLIRTDNQRARLWTSAGGKAVQLTTAVLSGNLSQGAGKVFFLADDGGHGFEPWVSDGTAAGTHLIKDVCRGTCSADVSSFATIANVTYFNTHGDLWRTDATEAGTLRLSSPPFSGDPFGRAF